MKQIYAIFYITLFISIISFYTSDVFAKSIVINRGSVINYEISGNGQDNSGSAPFEDTSINNKLTVEEGATVSSRTYGSYIDWQYPQNNANYNSLILKGTATDTIYGVCIATTIWATATHNTVLVSGVSRSVYGVQMLRAGRVERNTVNISGIAEGDIRGVSIESEISEVTAINNLVVISSSAVSNRIIGAYIANGQAFGNGIIVSTSGIVSSNLGFEGHICAAYVSAGTATSNFVDIYGNVNISSDISSAYLTSGLATKNAVRVHEGAYVNGHVAGVNITEGISINNEVNISGHCMTGVTCSHVSCGTSSYNILNLSGSGHVDVVAEGARVGVGASKNEIMNISGVVNGSLIACSMGSGVVSDNVISIFGRVAGHVICVQHTADNGNVTVRDNVICIYDNASIGGNIYFDYSGKSIGNVINNTLIIHEGACLSTNSILWVGGKHDDTPNVFSGNTLEIYAKNIQIYGINNFEIYNFHLPSNIKKDDVIIDVKAGTGGMYQDPAKPINLSRTTVKVQFQNEDDIPILNVGDKIYLIVSSGTGTGIDNAPVNNNTNIGMNGSFCTTLLYDYSFLIRTTDTSLYLEVKDSKFDLNPKANNCLEEGTAQILFVNRSLDLLADKGIREAVDTVSSNNDGNLNSYGKAGAFGIVSWGNLKYGENTLEIKGISFIAGIAKEYVPIVDKKLVLGAFWEHGEGEYTVKTSYDQDTIIGHLSGKTEGKGKPQYMGIGILGRFGLWNAKDTFGKIIGEVYLDGSAKIGKTDSSYKNRDMIGEGKFNTDGTYYGGHLGCGYIRNLGILDLEGYFKWLYVHEESKKAKLVTGDIINFRQINSSRLKLGIRSIFNLSWSITPFIGLGAEYETQGRVAAKTFIFELEHENLCGWTQSGEFGVKAEISNFRMELSIEGYSGKKKGLVGLLRISYLL
ncbi:MAG: autotransporter outer membrane beta-barrel domain-containing protein [Endomicrobium sp.]|jgi:hypothetical protein|nr:autotransporter outer membrane beta-barrel domain-containing protein [Endomicrobium sp.]